MSDPMKVYRDAISQPFRQAEDGADYLIKQARKQGHSDQLLIQYLTQKLAIAAFDSDHARRICVIALNKLRTGAV